MRNIEKIVIKRECIVFAIENNMRIIQSDGDSFIAEDDHVELNVPYIHIYEQLEQGFEIAETLQNESNHKESL